MMLFVVMCVSLLCPFTAQAATGMDSKSVCGEAKGTLTNLVTGETIDVLDSSRNLSATVGKFKVE